MIHYANASPKSTYILLSVSAAQIYSQKCEELTAYNRSQQEETPSFSFLLGLFVDLFSFFGKFQFMLNGIVF